MSLQAGSRGMISDMKTDRRIRRVTLLWILCTFIAAPALAQDGSWEHELAAWRVQHVADLLKPDSWLSLTGLGWLQPGDNAFGTATDNKIRLAGKGAAHIGILRLEGTTVHLLPPADGFPSDLRIAGAPARAQVIPVEANNDKNAPHLTVGTLNMYVIRREDRFALRVKDSNSATLVGFHGLNWYDPGIKYRVNAKWLPYNPPKSETFATLVGTTTTGMVPGVAEFDLSGKTYRLEPVLEDPAVPKLFFILRDTTSATTTYPACRFLYTTLPSHGLDKPGELLLDFNKLENPPCAFTAFATCPLPPPQNRLPIALPVGEKRYHQ
ncbi:MAG TPA: DUF1684 domain-containing protein [Candidatus Acidoferrum sp.]|nr:DUF1684 domain-containing protein [Candidatus Acidoferrum sp.]